MSEDNAVHIGSVNSAANSHIIVSAHTFAHKLDVDISQIPEVANQKEFRRSVRNFAIHGPRNAPKNVYMARCLRICTYVDSYAVSTSLLWQEEHLI